MFWFRLAHEYKIPRVLLQEMIDSQEFTRELAYYQLEPWGIEATDIRHALLCSTIAAPNMPRGKRSRPKDHLPSWSRKRRQQSVAEMKAAFESVLATVR